MCRVVDLQQAVLVKNDERAGTLRTELAARGTTVVNLLSSPGSGKTELLEAELALAASRGVPVAALTADLATEHDAERRRAFLSCEGNDVLAVFNLETNQVIARLPMAKGADVVQFDPGLRRIYVACGSGAISVFQMDDPDRFHKIEDVRVPKRVHSVVVDARTHRVYAPAEEEDGRPVAKMLVFEPRERK